MVRRLAACVVASSKSRHYSLAVPGLPPYRVLFFGTDDISLATLKVLHANRKHDKSNEGMIEHIEVVCPSDRPTNGRKKIEPVPVKKFAQPRGIKVYDTPSDLKSLKTWNCPVSDQFDVAVVVSFGYFLFPHLLRNLYHGAINMHPSLLPKYRGPAPIHHALLNGDSTTGVSVIEIDSKAFDVGRILLQKPYEIKSGIQCQELTMNLAAFGADCVLTTLANLPSLKKTAVMQDDALACKAPKLKHKDGLVSFDVSAEKIFYRWQALSNSVGINVSYKGKVLKLIEIKLPTDVELESVNANEARYGIAAAGTFYYEKIVQALWLRCANSSWLKITSLQHADRKIVTALDFCNGYRLKDLQREQFDEIPVDSDSNVRAAF